MLSFLTSTGGIIRFLSRITCALLSLTSLPLRGELLTRDLGDGLTYTRAEALPRDLPSADAEKSAMILDLRYCLAEADAPAALQKWLQSRASAKTPVFVLINAATAPSLRDLLEPRASAAGIVTLGQASAETKPDIPVSTSEEEERRAYDAAHSEPIEALIKENADKPRVDEASIMDARRNLPEEEPFQPDPFDRITPAEKKPESTTRPPVDRVLQRAIHLHRAMRALKLI